MPKQGSSTEIKRQLDAIVSAAKALEATVHDMAQSAAAPAPAQAHLPRAMDEAAAAAATLDLSEGQRRICERVINVFETGTLEGKYGAISIFHDGPGRIRQITYGRSQTTEYGNLRQLVQMYADANGTFSARLRPFIDKIGRTALVDDDTFKDLLRRAGNEDPIMRTTQDLFFERRYFQPALSWARSNGFTRALSMLVIYDSFIHSGRSSPSCGTGSGSGRRHAAATKRPGSAIRRRAARLAHESYAIPRCARATTARATSAARSRPGTGTSPSSRSWQTALRCATRPRRRTR